MAGHTCLSRTSCAPMAPRKNMAKFTQQAADHVRYLSSLADDEIPGAVDRQ